MSLPVPPSIQTGQIALDPVNGIVYYKDKNNNIVSTSLNWTKTDLHKTNATDGITIDNNLTVAGNLIVGGDTISLNVSQVYVEDNILILNSNVTGSPSLNAGIEVERGVLNNVSILWNESTDKWQYTNNGIDFYNLINSSDITATTSLPSLVTIGTITSGTWNGTVISGQYGGTGIANTGKTITVSGNTTIGSSTHTVTFVTSGNTSVTLPTSGTLVNTAVTSLSSLATVGTISSGTWNGTAIAGQYGGTGVANTGKTITVSGNTTIGSSTHTVTFATSGNTSVTLPTSGTLVNTSVTSLSSLATVGTISSGTWNGSTIGLAYGGTGATSAPAAMAVLMGYTSTATAGATTTLTNTSSYYQQFTGSSNQTVKLPVTSTLQTGWTFHIVNNSTGTLTVNSSGSNLVTTVPSQTTAMVTCIGTTLTTAADWESGLTDFSNYTGTGSVVLGTGPTINNLTLSGTLTAASSAGTSGQVLQSTGTGVQWATVSGAGTVTSITAGTGLSGGTITTSGTIAIDSTVVTLSGSQSLTNKKLGSLTSNGIVTTSGGDGTLSVTATTGSGSVVLATSPTLTTPTIGVATATSINKVAITAPVTSATLTIADGKTLTASNTLTFTGTDSSSVAFGTGGTVVYTSNKLSVHAATTSAELAGVISDETGSGALVFGTSPAITTSLTTGSSSFDLINTTAATVNFAGAGTSISVGASSGTFTVNNVTIAHPNATSMTMNGASPSITTTSTGTASVFNTNALTGNLFGAATIVSIGAATGTTTINNGLVLKQVLETVTIDSSTQLNATTATNIDVLTSSIYYFNVSTGPSADNFIINIRGNSTVTDLNNIMSTGQMLTVSLGVDKSGMATPNTFKLGVIRINGVSQTINWFGGSAPSSGNTIDMYSISILKTGASTYKVFANQTKFA